MRETDIRKQRVHLALLLAAYRPIDPLAIEMGSQERQQLIHVF
jgi:hypothetical protein